LYYIGCIINFTQKNLMVLATSKTQTAILQRSHFVNVTWEKLPDDFILPDDPVENLQQPTLASALTDALGAENRIQPQMLIASNFGLVATVNQKTIVKAAVAELESERQKKEILAAKLRELGIDPDGV
jgi:hypothetical protein